MHFGSLDNPQSETLAWLLPCAFAVARVWVWCVVIQQYFLCCDKQQTEFSNESWNWKRTKRRQTTTGLVKVCLLSLISDNSWLKPTKKRKSHQWRQFSEILTKAGAILQGIHSLSDIFVWMCFYFLNIKCQADEFLGSETNPLSRASRRSTFVSCVQDVACSVLVNFQ